MSRADHSRSLALPVRPHVGAMLRLNPRPDALGASPTAALAPHSSKPDASCAMSVLARASMVKLPTM